MIESAQAQSRTLDRVRVPITAFILRAFVRLRELYRNRLQRPTHLIFLLHWTEFL